MARLTQILSNAGKFVTNGLASGAIGAIYGACLGALAGPILLFLSVIPVSLPDISKYPSMYFQLTIPFDLIVGGIYGAYYGAIGGFMAAVAGGSPGSSSAFRLGGFVGGLAVAVLTWDFVLYQLAPIVSILGGVLFGLYIDKMIKQESPRLILAERLRVFSSRIATFPLGVRIISSGLFSLATLSGIVLFWGYWNGVW